MLIKNAELFLGIVTIFSLTNAPRIEVVVILNNIESIGSTPQSRRELTVITVLNYRVTTEGPERPWRQQSSVFYSEKIFSMLYTGNAEDNGL
ncbi:hypothetical protein GCM10027180_36820 [Microbulbifer echini]